MLSLLQSKEVTNATLLGTQRPLETIEQDKNLSPTICQKSPAKVHGKSSGKSQSVSNKTRRRPKATEKKKTKTSQKEKKNACKSASSQESKDSEARSRRKHRNKGSDQQEFSDSKEKKVKMEFPREHECGNGEKAGCRNIDVKASREAVDQLEGQKEVSHQRAKEDSCTSSLDQQSDATEADQHLDDSRKELPREQGSSGSQEKTDDDVSMMVKDLKEHPDQQKSSDFKETEQDGITATSMDKYSGSSETPLEIQGLAISDLTEQKSNSMTSINPHAKPRDDTCQLIGGQKRPADRKNSSSRKKKGGKKSPVDRNSRKSKKEKICSDQLDVLVSKGGKDTGCISGEVGQASTGLMHDQQGWSNLMNRDNNEASQEVEGRVFQEGHDKSLVDGDSAGSEMAENSSAQKGSLNVRDSFDFKDDVSTSNGYGQTLRSPKTSLDTQVSVDEKEDNIKHSVDEGSTNDADVLRIASNYQGSSDLNENKDVAASDQHSGSSKTGEGCPSPQDSMNEEGKASSCNFSPDHDFRGNDVNRKIQEHKCLVGDPGGQKTTDKKRKKEVHKSGLEQESKHDESVGQPPNQDNSKEKKKDKRSATNNSKGSGKVKNPKVRKQLSDQQRSLAVVEKKNGSKLASNQKCEDSGTLKRPDGLESAPFKDKQDDSSSRIGKGYPNPQDFVNGEGSGSNFSPDQCSQSSVVDRNNRKTQEHKCLVGDPGGQKATDKKRKKKVHKSGLEQDSKHDESVGQPPNQDNSKEKKKDKRSATNNSKGSGKVKHPKVRKQLSDQQRSLAVVEKKNGSKLASDQKCEDSGTLKRPDGLESAPFKEKQDVNESSLDQEAESSEARLQVEEIGFPGRQNSCDGDMKERKESSECAINSSDGSGPSQHVDNKEERPSHQVEYSNENNDDNYLVDIPSRSCGTPQQLLTHTQLDQNLEKLEDTHTQLDQNLEKLEDTHTQLDQNLEKLEDTRTQLDQNLEKLEDDSKSLVSLSSETSECIQNPLGQKRPGRKSKEQREISTSPAIPESEYIGTLRQLLGEQQLGLNSKEEEDRSSSIGNQDSRNTVSSYQTDVSAPVVENQDSEDHKTSQKRKLRKRPSNLEGISYLNQPKKRKVNSESQTSVGMPELGESGSVESPGSDVSRKRPRQLPIKSYPIRSREPSEEPEKKKKRPSVGAELYGIKPVVKQPRLKQSPMPASSPSMPSGFEEVEEMLRKLEKELDVQ